MMKNDATLFGAIAVNVYEPEEAKRNKWPLTDPITDLNKVRV